MARTLDDAEIDRLLNDPKPVPQDWRDRLQPRGRQEVGHKRRSLKVTSTSGAEYRVDTRQSNHNSLDFSIILTFIDRDGVEYRLLRCNGLHASRHTNRIESERGDSNAVIQTEFMCIWQLNAIRRRATPSTVMRRRPTGTQTFSRLWKSLHAVQISCMRLPDRWHSYDDSY